MSASDYEADRLEAQAMLHEGQRLAESEDADRAIESFDRTVARYSGHPDPFARSMAGLALSDKAWVLVSQGSLDDALEVFDEALRLAGGSEDPDLRGLRAHAGYGKGWVLNALGRKADAALVLHDMYNGLAEDPPADDVEPVVEAALVLGGLANDLGEPDKAIEIYDSMVERFREVDEAEVQSTLGRALYSKAAVLSQLGRFEEAVDVTEQVVDHVSRWSDPAELDYELALGLSSRGRYQRALGRNAEAAAAHRELLGRFPDGHKDPELVKWLEFARSELQQLTSD